MARTEWHPRFFSSVDQTLRGIIFSTKLSEQDQHFDDSFTVSSVINQDWVNPNEVLESGFRHLKQVIDYEKMRLLETAHNLKPQDCRDFAWPPLIILTSAFS